jgi:hypothetical protein
MPRSSQPRRQDARDLSNGTIHAERSEADTPEAADEFANPTRLSLRTLRGQPSIGADSPVLRSVMRRLIDRRSD